jgi:hypothetical protein
VSFSYLQFKFKLFALILNCPIFRDTYRWAEDIISEFSSRVQINDTIRESYARACFNYAHGFFGFGDGLLNGDVDRKVLSENERLSTERINKFIFYQTESIREYEEISKSNPNYNTFVGNVKIKIANDYMYMCLQLNMNVDSIIAKSFASKAIYPDTLLDQGKSFLLKLPKNSILITYGDNDTYPLLHLQSVLGLRKDVTIINYNLLASRRYVWFIKRQKSKLISLNESALLSYDLDYSLFSNSRGINKPISVAEFLKNLEKGSNHYADQAKEDVSNKWGTYYSKDLYFLSKNLIGRKFKINNYLLFNDFVLFDLVNYSIERPIYFTFEYDLFSNLLQNMNGFHKFNAF